MLFSILMAVIPIYKVAKLASDIRGEKIRRGEGTKSFLSAGHELCVVPINTYPSTSPGEGEGGKFIKTVFYIQQHGVLGGKLLKFVNLAKA